MENTSGAVHLTSLSLDITELQKQAQIVGKEMDALAEKAIKTGEQVRGAFKGGTGGVSGASSGSSSSSGANAEAKETQRQVSISLQAIANLQKGYANLEKTIINSKLTPAEQIKSFIQQIEDAQVKLQEYRNVLNQSGKNTLFGEQAEAAKQLKVQLIDLGKQFAEVSAGTNLESFIKLNTDYKSFIQTLETGKTKLSENSAEFQQLREIAKSLTAEMNSLTEKVIKNGSASQQDTAHYNDMKMSLSALNQMLKETENQAIQTGNGISKKLTASLKDFASATLNSQKFAQSLIKGKTDLDTASDSFRQIKNEAIGLANQLTDLNKQIIQNGTVSKQDAEHLVQLNQQFTQLKLRLSEAELQANKTGIGLKEVSSSVKNLPTEKIAQLNLQYQRFLTQLSGKNYQSSFFADISQKASSAASEINELTQRTSNNSTATSEQARQYEILKRTLTELRTGFEQAKQSANEQARAFDEINHSINEVIPKLRTFEQSATFKNARQGARVLRLEYQELAARIKNGTISMDDAKSQLSALGAKFDDLSSHINTGSTALQNFVNKIVESAKWQIANMAIMAIRQGLRELTGTIIEAENAAIELRRVLGEEAPSNIKMTDELYNIAYEYGQTFEAVQESAVKFAQTGMSWNEIIDATRATMLALNTAELNTAQATEGLIAVMAQFGIEATDLEEVIDKINITADNFPVTSEKIVSALQRAGGTASSFGMTLEETIAVITALSEATGRAGANIGTALNSLIVFSMKSGSLNKFSEFLGEDVSDLGVLELWDKLSKEIHGSGEELAKMMSQSEEFSGLMDETLATSIGLEDEYNAALKEQNEILKDGKDIYSTVGTYRQNYFIALLKNIQTAKDALSGLNNAIGYSQQENEVAMEAFSKRWQQLKNSFAELAVDFGNSGFLDLMKILVQIADSAVRAVGAIGGLNTVLGILATIIFKVKGASLSNIISGVLSPVNSLIGGVKNLSGIITGELAKGVGTLSALKTGFASLSITGLTAFSAIATAASIAYGLYNTWQRKMEEARQENMNLGKEATDTANSIANAWNKLQSAGSPDERESAAKEIFKLLELSTEEIEEYQRQAEKTADPEKELNRLIKERLEDLYEELKVKQQIALIDAEKSAKEQLKKDTTTFGLSKISGSGVYNDTVGIQVLKDSLDGVKDSLKDVNVETTSFTSLLRELTNVNGFDDANKKLEIAIKLAGEFEKKLNPNSRKDSYIYKSLQNIISALLDYTSNTKPFKEAVDNQADSLDEYSEKVKNSEDSISEAAKTIAASSEEIGLDVEALGERISDASKKIDEFNSKVDSFQSAYNTLKEVSSEYNKTGRMTADMVQTLLGLEPEYLELLSMEGDQMSINDEKLQELMGTNEDYLVQMAAIKTAKQVDALANDLLAISTGNLTEKEVEARLKTMALQTEIENAAYNFYSGKSSASAFQSAIETVGRAAELSAGQIAILSNNSMNYANAVSAVLQKAKLVSSFPNIEKRAGETGAEFMERVSAAQRKAEQEANKVISATSTNKKFWFPSTTSKSSGSSGSKKKTALDLLEEQAKKSMDALNDLLDVYEHTIFLIEKNDGNAEKLKNVPYYTASDKDYAEQIVAIYRTMQKKVHEQADEFRKMGFGEDSKQIRELQKLHWDYHDKIIDIYGDMYDRIIGEHENMVDELQYQYEQLEKAQDFSGMNENLQKQVKEQKAIQESALKEYEQLLKVGVKKNDDAAQEVLQRIREAANEIEEINNKIKESVLGAYDDFISAADKFDLWENLDFTKVDYLQRKMQAINQLFKDGTITLQEYNSQLRSMTEAMYDAQIEQFEKQQDETKKYYDDLINQRKKDIESLKTQKDETKDYYDSVISGYKEEIDQWNKRKDEVTEYYDELISALEQVQKDNDRINRQIDYYNSRQKIITNLEQAQARSGVEWREKEMEYQQQLIDLDTEWGRTLKEWSIEDQIAKLNDLRDAALADIDATIEAINGTIEALEKQSEEAIKGIENEIKGIENVIDDLEKKSEEAIDRIEERIKELSKQIAAAFSSASMNGMLNTSQSITNAFANAGSQLFGGGVNTLAGYGNTITGYGTSFANTFVNSAQIAASQALKTITKSFVNPMLPLFGTLGTALKTSLTNGAIQAAQNTNTLFGNVFSNKTIPSTKSSISNVMKSSTGTISNNVSDIISRNTKLADAATNSLKTSSGNAVIYVTNNVNSVDSAAEKTNNIIQNLSI